MLSVQLPPPICLPRFYSACGNVFEALPVHSIVIDSSKINFPKRVNGGAAISFDFFLGEYGVKKIVKGRR